MIVPDVNLLLYAYDALNPFHSRGREVLEPLRHARSAIGIDANSACLIE